MCMDNGSSGTLHEERVEAVQNRNLNEKFFLSAQQLTAVLHHNSQVTSVGSQTSLSYLGQLGQEVISGGGKGHVAKVRSTMWRIIDLWVRPPLLWLTTRIAGPQRLLLGFCGRLEGYRPYVSFVRFCSGRKPHGGTE